MSNLRLSDKALVSGSKPGVAHQSKLRRSACDRCRRSKVKCSGELPFCQKCTQLRLECNYSLRIPTGRPKARDSRPSDADNSNPNVITPTMPQRSHLTITRPSLVSDSPTSNFPSEIYHDEQQGTENWLTTAGDRQPPSPHDFPTGESHEDIQTSASETLAQDLIFCAHQCACLSGLYLTLEKLRATQVQYPLTIRVLQEAVKMAAGVIICQNCPRRYLSATQNSLLLGALVLSIADCYRRVLEVVKCEAQRLSHMDQNTPFQVGENGDFTVELSPSEWKTLAYKILKVELFGPSKGSIPCFLVLIENLEQRQTAWHTVAPGSDFPPTFCVGYDADRKPICLLPVKEARTIIELLAFG